MQTESAIAIAVIAAIGLYFYRKPPGGGHSGASEQPTQTTPVGSNMTKAPITKPTRNNDPIMPNTGTGPRGIRNNNPLNIEFNATNQWDGQTGSDGRFAIFTTPFFGIRAAGRLLRNYRVSHGLNTPRGIISRWAPAFENNVSAYLNSVTKRTGFLPDLVLNQGDYPALVAAMILHENGQQPYTMQLIAEAVNAGFN